MQTKTVFSVLKKLRTRFFGFGKNRIGNPISFLKMLLNCRKHAVLNLAVCCGAI